MDKGVLIELLPLDFDPFDLISWLELEDLGVRDLICVVQEPSLLRVEPCRHEDQVLGKKCSIKPVHNEVSALLKERKVLLFK